MLCVEGVDAVSDGYALVRVHTAAGLALIARVDSADATRWVPWSTEAESTHSSGAVTDQRSFKRDDDDDEGSIHLEQTDPGEAASAPSLAFKREHFDGRAVFDVVAGANGLPPQNLVVFLHGRGDSHAPFARLGAQMALPQTGVISLRAPLELPFEMGFTWIDDLDDDYEVVPSTASNIKRSQSLHDTRDFVWSFLETLRDRYRWPLERVFLFAFSQGASVAFHTATTVPVRLGGVVLVAGGAVNGPHMSRETFKKEHETPVLLLSGDRDEVFPLVLAQETQRQYSAAFNNPRLFTLHVVTNKGHDMIRSGDEMRAVMSFFSQHLYLRNIALENRSDVIEITTKRRHKQPPGSK